MTKAKRVKYAMVLRLYTGSSNGEDAFVLIILWQVATFDFAKLHTHFSYTCFTLFAFSWLGASGKFDSIDTK